MFFFKESLSEPEQQWVDMAASVTDNPYGRKFILKTDIATGHFKTVEFEDGLKIVLTDYTLNKGYSKVYDNSSTDFYYLHINQVKAAEQFSVFISGKELFFSNKLYSSVFLVCSAEPFEIKTTTGAYFNQLKIIIPKQWPARWLDDLFSEPALQRYLALGEERLYFDSIDAVYLKLVNRLVNEVEEINYLPLVHGIVTIIIQRFFFRMAARLEKIG